MRGFARRIIVLGAAACVWLGAASLGGGQDKGYQGPWDFEPSQLEKVLQTAEIQNIKSVGHTSLVLRLDMEGEVDAAFKPQSKTHPLGYRAEVAAYRIASWLGLDNVPPAVLRKLSKDGLRVRLSTADLTDLPALQNAIVWDDESFAWGANIYWVPQLHFSEMDRLPATESWLKFLKNEEVLPSKRRDWIIDLSNLLIFDYLIGNWDRFSGGNVALNRDEKRIVVRDHNLAFVAPLPERLHERLIELLRRAERLSKQTIERVQELDETKLREILKNGDESEGLLLEQAQLQEVLDRRQTILSWVGALVDQYGEKAVLCFP